MISKIFAEIGPYIEQYGLWAVFFGILLEDAGIPMPGEMILITGATIAGSTGKMSIVALLITAWAAAVTGDNLAYAVGRFAGRRLVIKYGHRLFITARRLSRAEEFYERYGPHVVVIARFLTLVRQLNGIAAGISNMPWWTFLLYNALGAALWAGLWGSLSYWLGASSATLGGALRTAAPFITVVGLVITVLFLLRFRRLKNPKGRRKS